MCIDPRQSKNYCNSKLSQVTSLNTAFNVYFEQSGSSSLLVKKP